MENISKTKEKNRKDIFGRGGNMRIKKENGKDIFW